MSHKPFRSIPGLFLLALLGAPVAHALDSDRQQAIEIEADRVEIDERLGHSIYSGHVRFSQGSLGIEADRITLFRRQGRVTRLLIEGSPARLKQIPEGQQVPMQAEARNMEYLADGEHLILRGQAEVRQNGNRFRSEVIHYDLASDSLKAGQDEPGTGERVRITIQPPGG